MIKKPEEMKIQNIEKLRDGKGTTKMTHLFTPDELKGHCRVCAIIELQPGCSIGFHEHIDEEEIYFILKGKGLVNDNGNEQEVTVGDAVLTGDGADHSIENTGDEPLVLMAVVLTY